MLYYISVVLLSTTHTHYGKQQRIMSKYVIFLCFALVSSAVQASYTSDVLVEAQQTVENTIATAINEVNQKAEAAKQNALEIAGKLEVAANSFVQKFNNEINQSLETSKSDIVVLTGDAKDVDITDCNKLVAHLDYTGLIAVSNMSSCVFGKVETGKGYIKHMIKLSKDVIANLTAIREEAHHCGDNIDGVTSAAGAIICLNLAAAKATWTATKSVPAMVVDTTKLTFLLVSLQPSLAFCTTINGIATFHQESSIIVRKINECIRQKIVEVRNHAWDADKKTEVHEIEQAQISTHKPLYSGDFVETTEQVAHNIHQ